MTPVYARLAEKPVHLAHLCFRAARTVDIDVKRRGARHLVLHRLTNKSRLARMPEQVGVLVGPALTDTEVMAERVTVHRHIVVWAAKINAVGTLRRLRISRMRRHQILIGVTARRDRSHAVRADIELQAAGCLRVFLQQFLFERRPFGSRDREAALRVEMVEMIAEGAMYLDASPIVAAACERAA